MSIEIVNPDALGGPGQRALAAKVLRVAANFDEEYERPDDPYTHGRSFTVIDAEAELILRLTRDQGGVESITIVAVRYWHAEMGDFDEDW